MSRILPSSLFATAPRRAASAASSLTELPGVIGPTIHTRGKSAEEINRVAEEWIEGKMRNLENRA